VYSSTNDVWLPGGGSQAMLYTEVTDSDVQSADTSTCRSVEFLESADLFVNNSPSIFLSRILFLTITKKTLESCG